MISLNLKFEAQVNKAASKDNISLWMLKCTFNSRDAFMRKKICKRYVRPSLEFAILVWNPFYPVKKKSGTSMFLYDVTLKFFELNLNFPLMFLSMILQSQFLNWCHLKDFYYFHRSSTKVFLTFIFKGHC